MLLRSRFASAETPFFVSDDRFRTGSSFGTVESAAWAALPQYTREGLQQLIARDLPDTQGAVIVEVDEHELEADEAAIVGERLAIIVLSSHHMYAASFVPRPPGTLLH